MHEIELKLDKGTYVLAVSGGVDSVVLLHLLAQKQSPVASRQSPENTISKDGSWKVTIAHFDHGIREDSAQDAEFVKSLAEKYGLEFELGLGRLGPKASEAAARAARYEFLNSVCKKHNAKLVTAHHQDDLLETAIINIIRGTGPHGIVNMLRNTQILRPLLMKSKAEILDYAASHNLSWHEDPTNADPKYLRNHVRLNIIPKLGPDRQRLLGLILQTAEFTNQIDDIIQNIGSWLFHSEKEQMIRARFVQLDFKTAGYAVRDWLVKNQIENIDKQLIERVVIATKTLQFGRQIDLDRAHVLLSHKHSCEILEI